MSSYPPGVKGSDRPKVTQELVDAAADWTALAFQRAGSFLPGEIRASFTGVSLRGVRLMDAIALDVMEVGAGGESQDDWLAEVPSILAEGLVPLLLWRVPGGGWRLSGEGAKGWRGPDGWEGSALRGSEAVGRLAALLVAARPGWRPGLAEKRRRPEA